MKNLRKYIRTVLNEASINDKGELVDFNVKTQYPHRKIGKFIKDYIDTNYEDWAKMGWAIFDSDDESDKYESETNTFWRVEVIDNPEDWDIPVLVTLDSDEEAYVKAREVGFSVDENGIITGLWGINMVENLQESKKPLKKVAAVLIKDEQSGEILLIKRNDKTPKWAMVTGKIDEGEDSLDAIEREMYEELFIRPDQVRFNYKGVEHFPAQNIDLYYYEGFVSGKFKPHLDEENLDYGWFSVDKLPSPLIGGLYNKIKDITTKEVGVQSLQASQLNEVRKQVRLVMEAKVMPSFYLKEAVKLLKEADEKSPTFQWDFTEPKVGIKDEPPITYSWDIEHKKTEENPYDIAKEYIDKGLSYIKNKTQAIEFIKDLKNHIEDLSAESKKKLFKYVALSLVGLVGFNTLSSIFSKSGSDVEKQVVNSIGQELGAETNQNVNIEAQPTVVAKQDVEKKKQVIRRPRQVSAELIDSLKDEEKLRTTFYDINDGAYTVGWGHAVFQDPTRGSTGGDYDFVPKYEDIIPGVTKITVAQAEQLLRDDINEARKRLDAVLDEERITVKIDQHMYDAMVSMVYNMGAGKKFKNSEFLDALKKGNVVKAYHKIDDIDSAALLDKYPGLIDRRAREKERFGRNLVSNQNSKELNNLS